MIRTQVNYFSNQGIIEGYKQAGINKYRYLATLDLRTSEVCRNLDGKTFNVDEAQTGVNLPPMHPFCRSVTVPDTGGRSGTRWARDHVTGKGIKVPANMTYSQWYDKFVRGNTQVQSNELKLKNNSSDEQQYKRYIDLIGANNMPKTLEDFQEMKYNNNEQYKFIKLDYQRRKKLIDNPELKLPYAENAYIDDAKFTKYIFNESNNKGYAKGKLFSKRLVYNINNYELLKNKILSSASAYPTSKKCIDEFGTTYEQKIVIRGLNEKYANVIVGWKSKDEKTWMTTAYIKEVNK